MNAFAEPEYPPALVAEIEEFFAQYIDWDELVLELDIDAPSADEVFNALLAFAPHLDRIEGEL